MKLTLDSTLNDLTNTLGVELFELTKQSLKDVWAEIKESTQKDLEEVAKFTALLRVKELMGEDVTSLSAHLDAQLSNLKFVNSSITVRANKAFWENVAKLSGSFLMGMAEKFV